MRILQKGLLSLKDDTNDVDTGEENTQDQETETDSGQTSGGGGVCHELCDSIEEIVVDQPRNVISVDWNNDEIGHVSGDACAAIDFECECLGVKTRVVGQPSSAAIYSVFACDEEGVWEYVTWSFPGAGG